MFSGYCISGTCNYPIFQVAELAFFRSGQKINTQKVNDTEFDAYRVRLLSREWMDGGIYPLEKEGMDLLKRDNNS